jgi:hypothetical protein
MEDYWTGLIGRTDSLVKDNRAEILGESKGLTNQEDWQPCTVKDKRDGIFGGIVKD